ERRSDQLQRREELGTETTLPPQVRERAQHFARSRQRRDGRRCPHRDRRGCPSCDEQAAGARVHGPVGSPRASDVHRSFLQVASPVPSTITTRRFLARPSALPLGATGSFCPCATTFTRPSGKLA